MISINQLTLRFGGFELFNNISFVINLKDRIGLVGKNGAGKSTLLKVMMRMQPADEGTVEMPSDISIGYLPQQMKFTDTKTIMEETVAVFSDIIELKKEIENITAALASKMDYESEEYMELINKLAQSNERYHVLGGDKIYASIEKTLMGLGFESSDFNRPTSEFSGGWRMRIELAKILLKRTNILFLDEPTNHLDIESIQWLEDFLKEYKGPVVLISHDRAFLDNITTRTVEISIGKLHDYKVPYSKYAVLRKERKEQQEAAFLNQQKMISKTEDFIERFRYKATKAVQVQSRIKQLEKIERLEIEEEDTSAINIKFPPAPRSGEIALEIKGLVKKYGNNLVLNHIELYIERGEKIAFVGKNGAGKTTLSKIIADNLPYEGGNLKLGHNIKIGYFAQNQDELLDESKTVFKTIDDIAVGDVRTKIRDMLGSFLFRGDDIDKKVKVLSGGERSRLAFIKLLLEPYNLLVLDEPTNHLDMHSKDILKNALLNYDGTLIIVSHDREFLHGLTNKVYEFSHHKIKEHIGDIYEFLQKKKLYSLKELEKKEPLKAEKTEGNVSDSKKLYLERKEIDRQIKKITNLISHSENKIESLETEIESLNCLLSSPENFNTERFKDYEVKKKEMEKEMEKWEVLHTELEGIKFKRNR